MIVPSFVSFSDVADRDLQKQGGKYSLAHFSLSDKSNRLYRFLCHHPRDRHRQPLRADHLLRDSESQRGHREKLSSSPRRSTRSAPIKPDTKFFLWFSNSDIKCSDNRVDIFQDVLLNVVTLFVFI